MQVHIYDPVVRQHNGLGPGGRAGCKNDAGGRLCRQSLEILSNFLHRKVLPASLREIPRAKPFAGLPLFDVKEIPYLGRFPADFRDHLIKDAVSGPRPVEHHFHVRAVQLVDHLVYAVGRIEDDDDRTDLVKGKYCLGKSRRILAPDTRVRAFPNAVGRHKARRQKIRHLVKFRPCAGPIFKFNCCLLSDARCRLLEASADCLLNQFHSGTSGKLIVPDLAGRMACPPPTLLNRLVIQMESIVYSRSLKVSIAVLACS